MFFSTTLNTSVIATCGGGGWGLYNLLFLKKWLNGTALKKTSDSLLPPTALEIQICPYVY